MFPARLVVSAHSPAVVVNPRAQQDSGCYVKVKVRVAASRGGDSRKYRGVEYSGYEEYDVAPDQYSYTDQTRTPKSRRKRVSTRVF